MQIETLQRWKGESKFDPKALTLDDLSALHGQLLAMLILASEELAERYERIVVLGKDLPANEKNADLLADSAANLWNLTAALQIVFDRLAGNKKG